MSDTETFRRKNAAAEPAQDGLISMEAQQAWLRQEVQKLPDCMYEVFALRAFTGLEMDEVARILGITPHTAERWFFGAWALLSKRLRLWSSGAHLQAIISACLDECEAVEATEKQLDSWMTPVSPSVRQYFVSYRCLVSLGKTRSLVIAGGAQVTMR